ncbi:MAG: hypothetical protein H0U49_00035 [Parachlamydiaceae bacterium]|nr:hypothetical protein [Parachlamydiaceae bacterium]
MEVSPKKVSSSNEEIKNIDTRATRIPKSYDVTALILDVGNSSDTPVRRGI